MGTTVRIYLRSLSEFRTRKKSLKCYYFCLRYTRTAGLAVCVDRAEIALQFFFSPSPCENSCLIQGISPRLESGANGVDFGIPNTLPPPPLLVSHSHLAFFFTQLWIQSTGLPMSYGWRSSLSCPRCSPEFLLDTPRFIRHLALAWFRRIQAVSVSVRLPTAEGAT